MAENLYVLFSAISAGFSGCVVLTEIIFPGVLLSESRPFSTLIFFISLTDFGGSVGNALGFPLNGSAACTAQAFITLFLFPASWFYTTALVWQLRCALIVKNSTVEMNLIHFTIWPLSFLLSLLPLSTNTFGEDDAYSGESPCNIGGNSQDANAWLLSTFLGVLLFCFVFMAAVTIETFVRISNTRIDFSRPELFILRTASLYPLGMLVTWGPRVIKDYFNAFGVLHATFEVSEGIDIWATQYGTVLAIIFSLTCSEARYKWSALLAGVCHFPCSWSQPKQDELVVSLRGRDSEVGSDSLAEGVNSRDDVWSSISSRPTLEHGFARKSDELGMDMGVPEREHQIRRVATELDGTC